MGATRRRRARTARTRTLAATAGTATAALLAAEAVHLWRRRGGEQVARETVETLRAGQSAGPANETSVLNLFLSFGATFAVARAVTHSIRRGHGLLRNIEIGRRHIHHYVPGILLVLVAGGVSIGLRDEQLDHWLALPFGAGAALIVDETALLLELSDVYWSEQGVLSIDIGLGATSALASLALLLRMLRRGQALAVSERTPPEPLRPR